MPNLNLPTDIVWDSTDTMDVDIEAAWAELNELSRNTGLRDITSMLLNGWTASTVRLRRIRNETIWEFFNLNGSAATSTTIIDLSTLTNFRPSATYESELMRNAAGDPGYFRVSPTTLTAPIGFVFPGSTIRTFKHRCSAPWPTEFPGTPVAG